MTRTHHVSQAKSYTNGVSVPAEDPLQKQYIKFKRNYEKKHISTSNDPWKKDRPVISHEPTVSRIRLRAQTPISRVSVKHARTFG